MNSSRKLEAYEVIPARMVFRAIPNLAEGVLPVAPAEEEELRELGKVSIRGAHTPMGSGVKAQRQANELLRKCRWRLRQGDIYAVWELLDYNPEFIMVPWVRENVLRLYQSDRSLRRPGRPQARYKMNPLRVMGLVEGLIGTGQAPNLEKAFWKLDELGVLTYERAKNLFYQAKREKRFRPVLITFPELTRRVTEEELTVRQRGTEVLEPGKAITRTCDDPVRGRVNITFEAK